MVFAALAAVVFVSCDNLHVLDDTPESRRSSLVNAAKEYYEEVVEQPASLAAKTHDDSTTALVLAEMVRQYPPDWTQAVTWPGDNVAFHAATILGADKPATSFSSDKIAVVRTILVDLDAKGEVLDGRLLEFVSPDPLDRSLFADYTKDWLQGNYDATKMLAVEYTLGYASTKALLYNPVDKGLSSKSVTLQQRLSVGKAHAGIYYCWVSDVQEWFTCAGDERCDDDENWNSGSDVTEITCVCIANCGGGGSGGGDSGDSGVGDDGSVGGGGGDDKEDEDEEEEESEFTFSMSCSDSVTRGDRAGCNVTIFKDGETVDPADFLFEWSSSTGFTLNQSGMDSWYGTATGTADISVAVRAENYEETTTATVNARQGWGVPAVTVTSVTFAAGMGSTLGLYNAPIHAPNFGAPIAGGGPWSGHYASGDAPSFSGTIKINDDYGGGSNTYKDARNSCSLARVSLGEYETYSRVNSFCGTTSDMNTFAGQIEAHEYGHNANLNKCLGEAEGIRAMAEMEAYNGSRSDVIANLGRRWREFHRDYLGPAMVWSPPVPGGVDFYHARNRGLGSEHWALGIPPTRSHTHSDCN